MIKTMPLCILFVFHCHFLRRLNLFLFWVSCLILSHNGTGYFDVITCVLVLLLFSLSQGVSSGTLTDVSRGEQLKRYEYVETEYQNLNIICRNQSISVNTQTFTLSWTFNSTDPSTGPVNVVNVQNKRNGNTTVHWHPVYRSRSDLNLPSYGALKIRNISVQDTRQYKCIVDSFVGIFLWKILTVCVLPVGLNPLHSMLRIRRRNIIPGSALL